jgi:hypothetical protein
MIAALAAARYLRPMTTEPPVALPEIPRLRRLTKSLAMLDAILSPEWEMRYYSFNATWGDGEQMASMRDGSGDEWFLLFSAAGAGLKGFAHELAPAADAAGLAARVRAALPAALASFRDEPAFKMQDVTFCAYRQSAAPNWSWLRSGAPDGAADLLALLDGDPRSYQRFAEEYYERTIPLAEIEAIYSHAPLSEAWVVALNPEVTLAELEQDVLEIGYPDAQQPRAVGRLGLVC